MTFIEFFDETCIENICVSLLKVPDRIILVGGDTGTLSKHIMRYDELFSARGQHVLFEKRVINKNNLFGIVEVLEAIINTYPDCHFDLTGGDDLYLTAMGIVFERYKEKKINMHRYSIASDKLIDCDADGEVFAYDSLPVLTVAENVRLYGGEIIRSELCLDDIRFFTADIRADIEKLWRMCAQDSKQWNINVASMERLVKNADEKTEELSFTVSKKRISAEDNNGNFSAFLKKLVADGIVLQKNNGTSVTIEYKNSYIKDCLEKSGKILELKTYLFASELTDDNGNKLYTDIMSGVTLDWDGIIERDIPNIENEVDLILMHGVLPVFVSCKNGNVVAEELYKLNAVAEAFGGSYGRKFLIAGSSANISTAIKLRASELGIAIIANVHSLSDSAFSKKISYFCK